MNTADRIREERRSMKMTQADLAEQLGISEMTVRRWESGKSSPRIEDINRLAKLLGSSVDYLMCTGEFPASRPVVASNSGDSDEIERTQVLPNMAYWGSVADNARNVAEYGDANDIADVSQMLKRALASLVRVPTGREATSVAMV